MKKLLLLSFACCSIALSYAQKVYFIYLQSENYSPFYVKMADKVYSSTSEGYLILSLLKDSTYSFMLGQPGKQAEPKFTVTINKADRGFLVKNTEGQYNLMDLQTQTVYKPSPVENKVSMVRLPENLFTNLLARAANDTTLLYEAVAIQKNVSPENNSKTSLASVNEPTEIKPVVLVPEPVKESVAQVSVVQPAVSAEVAVVPSTSTLVSVDQQEEKEKQPAEFVRSRVLRKSESSTTEGFGLVYLDNHNGEVDTIRIFIPNPKMSYPQVNNSKPAADEKRFLEMNNQQQPAAPKNKTSNDGEMKESTTFVEPRQKLAL